MTKTKPIRRPGDIEASPRIRAHNSAMARSFQIPRPFHTMSVLENLVMPLEYVVHRGSLRSADTSREAMGILESIGMADKAHTPSNRLSQVELRKMELARTIAARPRLLISDEAMAGLARLPHG